MEYKLTVVLLGVLITPCAQAYLGPGMSGGTVVAVFALIGAIFLGIFSILYYPIKRRLMKEEGVTQELLKNESEQ